MAVAMAAAAAAAAVTASEKAQTPVSDDAIGEMEATKRLEFVRAYRLCVKSRLCPSDRAIR